MASPDKTHKLGRRAEAACERAAAVEESLETQELPPFVMGNPWGRAGSFFSGLRLLVLCFPSFFVSLEVCRKGPVGASNRCAPGGVGKHVQSAFDYALSGYAERSSVLPPSRAFSCSCLQTMRSWRRVLLCLFYTCSCRCGFVGLVALRKLRGGVQRTALGNFGFRSR